MKLRQAAEPKLASLGDVSGEHGQDLWEGRAREVDGQRRVTRANKCLGDPLRTRRVSRDAGPQGRVVERDLTPSLAHMRDRDPAQSAQVGRPRRLRERVEVKDSREELGW